MSEQNQNGSFEPNTMEGFLTQLKYGITALPPERVQEIEDDIRSHFAEGLSAGEDEGALCAMLGDPDVLAREYVLLYQQEVSGLVELESDHVGKKKRRTGRHPVTMGFIAFGMFLLDVCIALPVWIVLGVVWLVLALGVVIAPCGVLAVLTAFIGIFVRLPWNMWDYPLINFFGGIAMVALGSLMVLGATEYGKYFIRWTKAYFRFHHRVIVGRNG